ncbi:MAG TPA: HEPN domain-containing protein [Anaerolineales bacterium]|nr:HEPN domain-containing protein [Anaerolineales bacterium]HLE89545.1 HEPN domain-containing protein [Anaerolineales bacterium]
MKDYSRKLLDKAIDTIEAAELLVDAGKSDIAAGRAYYAMFYIAEALLNEKGLRFTKHSGVHSAFGENFAKTNEMDTKFHRWLIDAFDKRLAGDYGVETDIETEVAIHMINQAREFLEAAQEYLAK